MNRILPFLALLFLAASGFGQSARLLADVTALVPAGGTVTLTATTEYDFEPSALGWEVQLPPGWTYESVSGPDVPAVLPQRGATSQVEFAYITVPARRAQFTFVVRYPADAKYGTLIPTALLGAPTGLLTLKPEPVALATEVSDPARKRTK